MTFAMTRQFDFVEDDDDVVEPAESSGAHTLLAPQRWRTSYVTQTAAVAAYALALVGLCYLAKPKPVPQDQPIELTMVADEAPAPTDNLDSAPTPPPVAEQTPTPPDTPPVVEPSQQTALATPETVPNQDVPPPPADQQELVAPVPPSPPAPVKQVKQAKPKPHQPAVAARTPSSAQAPAGGQASAAASNALPSYYANEVHARIARVASETIPEDFHGSGRVAYHLVISPSGAVISKSLSSSGNPTFDRAAAAALARAAPFPPTGVAKPVSLHGAIAYSQ